MKEIKEIMEMHRVNGGVGILTDRGLFRVNNKTVANIYTDEIEYEPVTKSFKELRRN